MRLTGNPDFEIKPSYNFTVKASVGSLSSTQDVALTITNIDDNAVIADWFGFPALAKTFNAPDITDEDLKANGNLAGTVSSIASVAYQWQISTTRKLPKSEADWTDIDGATGPAYTPVQADVRKYLRVKITYSDSFGTKTVISDPSGKIIRFAFNHTDPDDIWELESIPAGRIIYQPDIIQSGGGDVVFALKAGMDGDLFRIDPQTGAVRFKQATEPDYEEKTDYRFIVTANVAGHIYEQPVQLTIKDVGIEGTRHRKAMSERLSGTDEDAIIFGLRGRDTIRGKRGDDVIYGEAPFAEQSLYVLLDVDVIFGGPGNDIIFGGPGNDIISGGPGVDKLDGGPGTNTLSFEEDDKGVWVDLGVSPDQDRFKSVQFSIDGSAVLADSDKIKNLENLMGSSHSDTLKGDSQDNEIKGLAGNDKIFGGPGADMLWGGQGQDMLYGEDGNDVLRGGDGNDTLRGGSGADVIWGGKGTNILYGGPGADRFVWHYADGYRNSQNHIKDFTKGADFIRIFPSVGGRPLEIKKFSELGNGVYFIQLSKNGADTQHTHFPSFSIEPSEETSVTFKFGEAGLRSVSHRLTIENLSITDITRSNLLDFFEIIYNTGANEDDFFAPPPEVI